MLARKLQPAKLLGPLNGPKARLARRLSASEFRWIRALRISSLGRRASRQLVRFLVVSCIGVAATLTWQSYSDTVRAMIAKSSPQLGWLAPQTELAVRTTPDVVAPAAAASPDFQRLALGLASVRQTVEQLAAQLAAGQQQMAGDIAKLKADEQEILHKLSAAPPRPPAAPAPKPAAVTPPPSPSTQAR